MSSKYINRDISWLSFNERVLKEATNKDLPLLERLKFLSIYSSNLDEFYRVRMPALQAISRMEKIDDTSSDVTYEVRHRIDKQQSLFGHTLTQVIIPELQTHRLHLLYRSQIPDAVKEELAYYFFNRIVPFLQPVYLSEASDFFPENNKIYLVASIVKDGIADVGLVNIPSAEIGRFKSITIAGITYVISLDDIMREHVQAIFQHTDVQNVYSIKVTRDAELNIKDEYKGDLAEKIELQILKRDFGLATRFLYDGEMPEQLQHALIKMLKLKDANIVSGGRYHNLKDLGEIDSNLSELKYIKWSSIKVQVPLNDVWKQLREKDVIVHPPYHSYDAVLRFFSEAALDANVTEIYVTLYRIASDSSIGQALISAAKNGKAVTVFVELKARFDEANNLRWAAKMKAAGVKIIYSIPEIKVHAKVALVKRKEEGRINYYGLFATGNFNETTAKFYTDHVLLTTNSSMLMELELLFLFLTKRRKPTDGDKFELKHLLVAQFNLREKFIALIDDEIEAARQGKRAFIRLKLNNLEEATLVDKLYEAAQAGVKVELLIRGICTLKPGVAGLSENITVRRIVDRYLEHGRVFHFHNGGKELVYLGSADWLNRNIYRRIEVCFPIYEKAIKEELIALLDLQFTDNTQAVLIDNEGENVWMEKTGSSLRSQYEIYKLLKSNNDK